MYSTQEENELIRQARAGQQAACQQLLTAYAGLVKNLSRRYQYTPTGKIIADDALGILYLAFMEAIQDFDPERNIHFAAFLQSRLHSAISKAFKQACSYSQRTAHPAAANEADSTDYFDMLESPQPTPERKILACDELAAILSKLSKQEQHLLHLLYGQDLPQLTAARLLHISPQTLNKRKMRLQEHCRQLRAK